MATEKKKEVKMKDLKPAKDAKGGATRQANSQGGSTNRPGRSLDSNRGSANSGGGRNLN